jgi:16S rRNA (cytosine967-C5)-methyltransferase
MSKRRPQPIATLTPTRTSRDAPRTSAANVRALAGWVVDRTLETLSSSTVFLDSALERTDEQDQGLLRELSLGTLRWLRRIDHVLAVASQRPISAIEPALRAPLRIAAYQLLFLDRIPDHAAVNEGVEQARRLTHKGGAALANAVLRRIAREGRSLAAFPVEERDPIRRLAIEKSHPDFLVQRWLRRFGANRTHDLLDANNRPKAMQLLAFRDRGGRELLAESLIDEGIEVEPTSLSPIGLTVRSGQPLKSAAYRRGDLYIQDEASQAAALLPPPRPGERILDAAAAPGGKAFALLASEPEVKLVLADVAAPRLAIVGANLRRLGRPLPRVLADAGKSPFAAAFDRVVVDLPCSGTGTFRKNPELKWRLSEGEVGRLAGQGLRLLRGALQAVAPGGLLVAITCSLEAEENEDVVAQLRALEPKLALEPLETLPYPLGRHTEAPGRWRVLPEFEHDGFTVHVLRKLSRNL